MPARYIVATYSSSVVKRMAEDILAIGCAAGFAGDRTDAAGPVVDTLIARGGRGVLIFEMLAERTLALAQLARRQNPDRGYAPLMEPACGRFWGAASSTASASSATSAPANPRAAARRIRELARELGVARSAWPSSRATTCPDARGREILRATSAPHTRPRAGERERVPRAAAIADALRARRQVVVTGRVADPSLAVGPAMAHFGWSETTGTASAAPPSPGT